MRRDAPSRALVGTAALSVLLWASRGADECPRPPSPPSLPTRELRAAGGHGQPRAPVIHRASGRPVLEKADTEIQGRRPGLMFLTPRPDAPTLFQQLR